MPANIEPSGLEVSLVNAMSRETVSRQYIDEVSDELPKQSWLEIVE